MPRIRLDSSLADGASRWALPLEPAELMLQCPAAGPALLSDPSGNVLREFAGPLHALQWLDEDLRSPGPVFRWVGYLSYDLGRLFEELPATAVDELGLPLLRLTRHAVGGGHDARNDPLPTSPTGEEKYGEGRCGEEKYGLADHLRSNFTRQGYMEAVGRAIEYIAAGDIFQVNLSQRLEAQLHVSAAHLYARLQASYPAWYAALLDYGDYALVCNSPELFLRVEPGEDGTRRIITRPIKGTRPLQPGMEEQLRNSIKDQAELNMIVDLERNDLGRVCAIGSVRVSQTRMIEAHPTVYHGAATVEGTLRPDVNLVDLLRGVFPGGSITGAPKIRAMEIIEELERTRRGPYCGAIGYFESTGRLELNIAIRTMIVQDGRVHVSVGGGIVADSDPAQEYEETIVKAKAALCILGLDQQASSLP